MTIHDKKKKIKKLQKEHAIFKDIIVIMDGFFKNHEILNQVYCTRVELTADGGLAIVYLYTHQNDKIDQDAATEIIKKITSYQKQIFHQLCQVLSYNRYVPKLRFVFDSQQTKVNKINDLLSSLKNDY